MKDLLGKAARLLRDRRGVAAIEFAFIAPILLILYFLTMEASQAIETSKKVNRMSSMIGDLIAQQSAVDSCSLPAILQAANTTLLPYNRSSPKVIVTGIQITTDTPPIATVAWSYQVSGGQYGAGPEKAGDTTTMPSAIKTGGAFLIRVQSSLPYRPVIAWAAGDEKTLGLTSAFDNITMGATFYFSPRLTTTVTYSTLASPCP
ncbi:MAG: pilus assembly protein [Mesorhizobium sp.]|nr:TadE/TadG family type IV pilus assembly protein [Mesorhizobium sp.]MBN9241335.1 pilus assembly protein [Mesorhizobium sp.]MBN9268845.1 pilus assembly protein [Mesorhizobium sp.]